MSHLIELVEAGMPGILFILAIAIMHAVGMILAIYVAKVLAKRERDPSWRRRFRSAFGAAFAIVLGLHALEIVVALGCFAWRQDAYTISAARAALTRESVNFPLLVRWQLVAVLLMTATGLWSATVLTSIKTRIDDARGKHGNQGNLTPANR